MMNKITWGAIATITFTSVIMSLEGVPNDDALSCVASYFYGVAMCFIFIKEKRND